MNRLQKFLDLHTGEENKQKVLENVKANISFRGATVWILACAIVVASVGLNVNSTAVIIGAMLISPLMGPIVGAGFSLGIYDFKYFSIRSKENLGINKALAKYKTSGSSFIFISIPFALLKAQNVMKKTLAYCSYLFIIVP